MSDIMKRKDVFPLKHGISRRSYFRGMTDEERDRARWQLFKPHAPETPDIEPVYDETDLARELEALPPTYRRLLDQVAEHLPDPPKRNDKRYPRYDARRLRDPNKLRRSSGMPLNRMRGTIRQVYDEVLENARCKQYAIKQGLDYTDGKPFTTPKPFNRLAYLLERKRFGGRPTMPRLGTHQTVKMLAIGNASIPVKWKPVEGYTKEREKQKPTTAYEVQVSLVSDLLKPKMLQKGAWSPHHISVGNVLAACGEYTEDALLMLYGWLDRRAEATKGAFEVKHPLTQWPSAWL